MPLDAVTLTDVLEHVPQPLDVLRKMRTFLMTTKGLTEDEAISLSSVAVDFGVTQVVDGNWGIHAIVRKSLFSAG